MKVGRLCLCLLVGLATTGISILSGQQKDTAAAAETIPGSPAARAIDRDPAPLMLSPRTRRELALEAILDSSEHEFNYSQQPIEQIVAALKQAHGIEIVIDPTARDGDLPEKVMIDFQMGKVTLRTGLMAMLRIHNGTLQIEDNVLKIISRDVANDPEYFRTRHFQCESLLQLLISTDSLVTQRRAIPESKPGSPGINGRTQIHGGGVFQVPENSSAGPLATGNVVPSNLMNFERAPIEYEDVSPRRQASEILLNLIQNHVGPGEWFSTGEGDGVLSLSGGILTATQSEEILDGVKRLLHDLEQHLLANAARLAHAAGSKDTAGSKDAAGSKDPR